LETAQCRSTGLHKRREVVLDNFPKPIFDNVIIFVAEDVSERSDLVPWLSGQKHSGLAAELGYRFADAFETPLNRIGYQSVFFEARAVHAFRVPAIAWPFSIISSRRRAGLSEGKGSVSIDFLLEPRLSDRLFHHIDSGAEQFRKVLPEPFPLPEVVKAARKKAFIQPHCDIDIARVRLAPR
jgi:hypothetical protein